MEHNERTITDEAPDGADQEAADMQSEASQDIVHEAEHEEKHGHVGVIIAGIIVVLVIALAALYFWGSKLDKDMEPVDEGPTPQEILSQPDPALEELREQNTSDNADDIEADLLDTDIEALDAELGNIESELDAALDEEL